MKEKKPLRLNMIYDINSEFIKRLQNIVSVLYYLFVIAVLFCGLFILPFLTYTAIKSLMYLLIAL